MPITVKKNFKSLKINVPQTKTFWQSVGIDTVSTIRDNTERGIDAEGRQFKQYSKKYRKRRTKSGRSSRVNLTFTGNMLAAMGRGIRATTNGVRIIVSGEQGFKIFQNEKTREFFAVSEKEARKILNRIKRFVDRKN